MLANLRCQLLVCLGWLLSVSSVAAEDWSQWRGPRGDGTSLASKVPVHWDGTAFDGTAGNGKGNTQKSSIAWKVKLPGSGHASPITSGDRIFVVACEEADQTRTLLCLDLKTGQTHWQRTVLTTPLEGKHSLNSFASSTPATDGSSVYVSFLDENQMNVAAFDLEGNELWSVRPGPFSSVHGYCSCPVLFEDLVIVNGDHDGDAYLVALDRRTGKTVWKTARENKVRSYCTPIIRTVAGREQLMLSGSESVASYNPRTGEQQWFMDGPTEQFVASMVFNGELLFMTCGYPEHHMLAIRADGSGNVTDSHVAWRTTENASYVPSPIAVGDYFLVVSDSGIASCFDAHSGQRYWKERIGRHYSASLITAGGLVYFLSDDGVTKVIKPGKTFELIAENPLGEACYASPAVAGEGLLIRGEEHLWFVE